MWLHFIGSNLIGIMGEQGKNTNQIFNGPKEWMNELYMLPLGGNWKSWQMKQNKKKRKRKVKDVLDAPKILGFGNIFKKFY